MAPSSFGAVTNGNAAMVAGEHEARFVAGRGTRFAVEGARCAVKHGAMFAVGRWAGLLIKL